MLTDDNRIVYLDYLRIFAILGVITIHVSVSRINIPDISKLDWIIMYLYRRWSDYAVPIFIMISGVLAFKKEITNKELYTKEFFV